MARLSDIVGPLRQRAFVRVRGSRGFSRETALLVVTLALFNGSNYGFHVVVGRLLGPASYGTLAALLAVLVVASVPLGVVQTIVARRAAELHETGRTEEIDRMAIAARRALLPAGLAALLVLLGASGTLGGLVHARPAAVMLLGPYILLGLYTSVSLGILQGRRSFGRFAGVMLSGLAVRLTVAVAAVAAGLAVLGAVAATVLAQAASFVVAAAFTGSLRRGRRAGAARVENPFRGEIAGTTLALAGFWLLAELDLVLAPHFLPGAEAGFYSSAGLLARGVVFVATAVPLAAFPRFAAADRRLEERYAWLRRSLWSLIPLAVAGAVMLVLSRAVVLPLAFGRSFGPAARVLPTLAAAGVVLALVNLLTYFHVAVRTRAYLFLFAGAALEGALVVLWHHSPEQIAGVLLAVTALVAAAQLHAARAASRWAPVAERRGTPRRRAPLGELELSVVLPCRNSARGLAEVLRSIRSHLAAVSSYEVIVVSDGSTDDTVEVARGENDPHLRVLAYADQVGKGEALRVGLDEARGRYVAFMDSDGDIDPASLVPFISLMRLFEPDVVLASKRHPLSEVSYPLLRRMLSFGYQKLGRLLFRLDVRDTQTGLKLIRREVLEAVLPRMLEKRYAFDLELLVVARRLGFRRVFEAPVQIEYRFSSHVDVRAVARIFLDTIAIFYRRYVLDSYRAHPEQANEAAPPRPARRPRSNLRIAILNWRDLRNPDAGGAEVWTHEVARRWAAAGHEIVLVTSRFAGAAPLEANDGYHVRRVGRLRNGTFHLLAQRELARLRDCDAVVDEINTIPFFTPLWGRRLPPAVAVVHQLAAEVWRAELAAPLAALGQAIEPHLLRLYRNAPVVAVSESTRADLAALGLRDVAVVHGGRDEPPSLDRSKEAMPTLLFVGRLAANKRPDHAVAAFRAVRERLPGARLSIVGGGPLEHRLRTTVPEGVTLHGHVPRRELYERMARAHCLLVPSVREGWGLVVIEANSVGTPAIGYDVAGIRDSIRTGDTGLIVPASSPDALADAALRLLSDPLEYEAMRLRAREWASTFSWDKTADDLLTVVRDVAAAARTVAPGRRRPTLDLSAAEGART